MGLGRRGGKSGGTLHDSSAQVLRTTSDESSLVAEVTNPEGPDVIRIEMEARRSFWEISRFFIPSGRIS